jgi:hypothetical protein
MTCNWPLADHGASVLAACESRVRAEEDAELMEFADRGIADVLALEAQRYLAVVEAFRREGCEPHWRPEPPARFTRTREANARVMRLNRDMRGSG